MLNQAIKRNSKRFPIDFLFQLSDSKWKDISSQIVRIKSAQDDSQNLRSQFVNSRRGSNRRLPYAFAEQGIAMLSGVRKSEVATGVHIAIMRAFVEIRKIILRQSDLKEQLKQINEKFLFIYYRYQNTYLFLIDSPVNIAIYLESSATYSF